MGGLELAGKGERMGREGGRGARCCIQGQSVKDPAARTLSSVQAREVDTSSVLVKLQCNVNCEQNIYIYCHIKDNLKELLH